MEFGRGRRASHGEFERAGRHRSACKGNRTIPAIGWKLPPARHLPVLIGPGGVMLASAAFMDNSAGSGAETAIRTLVETWMAAAKAGDIATVLDLMTDDVIFMVPGREPFGKEAFA